MNQLRIDQQLTSRQLDEQAETRIALKFLRDSLAWERRLATLRETGTGTEPGATVAANAARRTAA
jgi:hypothetical protein